MACMLSNFLLSSLTRISLPWQNLDKSSKNEIRCRYQIEIPSFLAAQRPKFQKIG